VKREGKRTTLFTRRALFMMAGQTTALGLLGVRLYRVQVEEGARYSTLAESNRISARLLAPTRGRILDRFGTVLAGNALNWRALLLAEETTDVAATLAKFGQIVTLEDHDHARIDRDLKHSRRFIPVMLRDFLSWDGPGTRGRLRSTPQRR
jgi:penicillin-binding protein 2